MTSSYRIESFSPFGYNPTTPAVLPFSPTRRRRTGPIISGSRSPSFPSAATMISNCGNAAACSRISSSVDCESRTLKSTFSSSNLFKTSVSASAGSPHCKSATAASSGVRSGITSRRILSLITLVMPTLHPCTSTIVYESGVPISLVPRKVRLAPRKHSLGSPVSRCWANR